MKTKQYLRHMEFKDSGQTIEPYTVLSQKHVKCTKHVEEWHVDADEKWMFNQCKRCGHMIEIKKMKHK